MEKVRNEETLAKIREALRRRRIEFMKRNHEGYLQRVAEREADGISAAEETEKFGLTFDYQVWHIPFFSVARAFQDFAPKWCITREEDAWDDYAQWCDHVYFCVNQGMADEQPIQGPNYPYDAYGYSLLAVLVDKQGKIVFITSRWNEDEMRDFFISPKKLKEILGREFEKLRAVEE
jgi:hypothetical protein